MLARKNLIMKESEKQYLRSNNASIKERDKKVRQYERNIITIVNDGNSQITSDIRNINDSNWQINNTTNINNIMDNNSVVLNNQLKAEVRNDNNNMFEYTSDNSLRLFMIMGLSVNINPINKQYMQTENKLTDTLITGLTTEQIKEVKNIIQFGILAGKNQLEVAKEVQQRLDILKSKAERIVATESLRVYAITDYETALQTALLNKNLRKMWNDLHKPNARRTHIDVEKLSHAEPLKIDQLFNVAGEKARFPRDYTLSAKNTVYCGCYLTYTMEV